MRPPAQDVKPDRSSSPGELERNIGRYFAGRVLLAIGGFASIPLLTRAVGVAEYGRISLWIAAATWVTQLVGSWLQQSVLRYHKTYHLSSDAPAYHATAKAAVRFLAAVSGLIPLAASALIGGLDGPGTVAVAAIAAGTTLNVYWIAVAQAELRAGLVVSADLFRTVAPVALFLIHLEWFGKLSASISLFYFAVGIWLANLMLYTLLHRELAAATAGSNFILRRLLAFGAPMGLWVALAGAQVLTGRLVLQFYGMRTELGVYNAVQDFFTKTATVLFMPVTFALHGHVMASWAAGGYGHARSAVSRAYLYQAIIGIPLLIVVFVGHRAVTTTLLGRVAVSGDLVTPWFLFVMMLAVMLFNLALVAQKGLELAERTPTLACLLAACIALNICLAILLAPHLGMLGVAYASVIATLVYFAASHTLSARFLVVAQRAAR